MLKSQLIIQPCLRLTRRMLSSQTGSYFGQRRSNNTNNARRRNNFNRKVNPNVVGTPGKRPNTMILFPGDFSIQQRLDRSPLPSIDDDITNYVDPEEEKARQEYKKQLLEEEEKRARWRKNAEPKIWVSQIDERGRSFGRGGRKRAQASVWIQPGMGHVVVNRRPFTDYFARMNDREICLEPFVVTETCGLFDITCVVKGGGLTGQAGAIRLGISRALNAYDPDRYRPALKFKGMLTRDTRRVERKKVGRVKARKSPQWVRR